MEINEISVCMDVKLDIYDKRPDSLKFKTWTKCQVKIEAIKCLPCFLRVTIQSMQQIEQGQAQQQPAQLSVSINVPGITISLATSRTKQYSYGLFWTHNRRDCFIYFAADTDVICRKHMKWIKKSIKSLEVYRQVFLEQRRSSRGGQVADAASKGSRKMELSAVKDALSALGPLPQIPVANNNFNWSRRVSRASDIYEEIFEGNFPPRLSRRLSRASIASGIYEEMKPCSQSIIDAIVEEHIDCPPPLPPLPPHRKRINTFEADSLESLGEIPRSNTNPESDLAKKKKYKNVLDNIFGTGRSKRAESVSETQTCTMDDIINGDNPQDVGNPIYANDILKRPDAAAVISNKRNSFSSPDLSKINFLDTFDEDKIAAFLLLQNSNDDLEGHDADFDELNEVEEHNYSSLSLDDSSIGPSTSRAVQKRILALKAKAGSMESLNISEQLPQNFNFSACNSSSINLVGASGAVPSLQKMKRNKIVIEDDLTGYCIMAPILNKKTDTQETTATPTTSSTTSSTSSGYSTGSYCSTTSSSSSSNTNSSERNKDLNVQEPKAQSIKTQPTESDYDLVPLRRTPMPVKEQDSNIYENMQSGSPLNGSIILRPHDNSTPPLNKDFSGNLYENLLTIKAAQELEQPLPANVCTSTPTEASTEKDAGSNSLEDEQENYYQTPRKSIISVDDKVPSYYPNSCDTMKMKRGSISPSKQQQQTPPTSQKKGEKEKSSNNTLGLKHLVNIKMKRERKENLYISSPQKILEQRKQSAPQPSTASTNSRRSQNAQKISENVYTVNLNKRKSLLLSSNNNNNNNNTEKTSYNEINDAAQLKEKLHTELLQLALLQNIDFKFDDTTDMTTSAAKTSSAVSSSCSPSSVAGTPPRQSGIRKLEEAELEYENCYRATKDATRLLHKYATLAPKQSMRIKQQLQHHLQINQTSNQKDLLMTQSTKSESPLGGELVTSSATALVGSKKFASLPRFKKIDFSPLKLKINNVLQRNQQPDF